MPRSDHYALWLMPPPACADALQQVIRNLAQTYGTPYFAPHLTLLGTLSARREYLVSRTRQIAAELHRITLRPARIESEDSYFRCLYIEFAQSAELAQSRETAAAALDQPPGIFSPHMSLYYGRLASTARNRLKHALAREMPDTVPLNRLALVDISLSVKFWHEIAEYPVGNKN